MKQAKKLRSPTENTPTEKRVWRVFCLLGTGRVSGSCGHRHPTLTHAMRCSYEPRAYQRDPEAELRARPVKVAR